LVRLASANCGSAWSQTFGYDAFGNITKTGSISFQPVYTNPQTGQNTNRFISIPGTSVSYDASGNVLSDGSHTYAWDAFGNSVTLDGVGVTYDALDRAVEQNRSGAYTQIVYSPTGAKLALMSGQTLQKAFVSLPGNATAVYTSAGLDHYRHSDWLGSARLTSSPSRTVLSSVGYAPFGETYAQSGIPDPSFTGQNPDTSSGDYDFLYREYTGTQGRWPSPDPAGLAAVDPANPQTWNRYAYVLNSPLAAVDPNGLWCSAPLNNGDSGCNPYNDGGPDTSQSWLYSDDIAYQSYITSLPAYAIMVDGHVMFYSITIHYTYFLVEMGVNAVDLGSNLAASKEGDNSSWWGTFGSTFLHGVLHGVSEPGQSFKSCFVQNANQTTFGAFGKIAAAGAALAPFAAAATAQVKNVFEGDPEFPGATMSVNMRVAMAVAPQVGVFVTNLTGSFSTGVTVANSTFLTMFNGTLAAGYAGAVAGGAAIGTAIGSAINCR